MSGGDEPSRADLEARVAALEIENQRLRWLLDQGVGVWVIDEHSRTTYANRRMADMLGCTVEELSSSSMFDFMDRDAAAAASANVERRRAGVHEVHDFLFRRRDGTPFRAVLVATPLFAHGAYLGALAYVLDFVELAEARRSLPPSGVEIVRLCEAAPVGVVLTDVASGEILAVNRAAAEMLGRPREALTGRTTLDIGMWPDREARERVATAVTRDGFARDMDVLWRRGDGSSVEAIATSVRIEEGSRTCALTFAQDLTRLKRTEAELRSSQARFAALFQLNPVGTLVTRLRDGLVLDANEAMCTLLETERAAIIGRTTTALGIWSSAQRADLVAGVERDGRVSAKEAEVRTRRGDLRYVVAYAAAVEHGGERFMVSALVDVTEQRLLQEKLRLADRVATAGTMAAGVAHEINNPLTWILANVDHVLHQIETGGFDVATSKEALLEAREGAERVAKIVRDLRAMSQAPSDDLGPVDVNAVIRSAASMARNELRHRASLELELADVPRVTASETRLLQVFLNLLVNAAHAIEEGAADRNYVRVRSRVEGASVVADVEDTGAGIAEELRAHVFEPFFTTKPIGTGTGLGLSIARSIVASYGGFLSFESNVGGGTVFRVTLPIGEQVPEAPPSSAPETARPMRILAVDDEPLVLGAFRRLLDEHDVTTETKAAEALARIAAGERFDVILCDVMMPVITGIELAHRIAAIDPAQAEVIVFVSGGAFAPAVREALSRLPNVLLEKPVRAAALQETIARVAARRRLRP